MINTLKAIFLLTCICLNISCARTMQANILPDSKLRPDATRIYVFRPSFIGTIVQADVYQNNIIVGKVGPKGYIVWDTKPGVITLQGGSDFIKLIAAADKTYYFKLVPKVSIKSRAFNLKPITEDVGKKYLLNLNKPNVKVVY